MHAPILYIFSISLLLMIFQLFASRLDLFRYICLSISSFQDIISSSLHVLYLFVYSSEISCTSHTDCPAQQACIHAQCRNPCVEANPCNIDQDCQVLNHQPVCVKGNVSLQQTNGILFPQSTAFVFYQNCKISIIFL